MKEDLDITEEWLADRSDLNDAKILEIRHVDGSLTIQIDDEWSSFEGEASYRGPSAGALIARGLKASPEYDSFAIKEMIFEAHLESLAPQDCKLKIIFYGQYVLSVHCEAVVWRPSSEAR